MFEDRRCGINRIAYVYYWNNWSGLTQSKVLCSCAQLIYNEHSCSASRDIVCTRSAYDRECGEGPSSQIIHVTSGHPIWMSEHQVLSNNSFYVTISIIFSLFQSILWWKPLYLKYRNLLQILKSVV